MECAEIKKMGDIEDAHWWFRGKRDLVSAELRERKKGLLLDIGCGTGANIREFSRVHRVVGCEVSRQALRLSRKRGDFPLVLCSAEDLPFREGVFNYITALDVLEHIEDDEKTMRNIRSVMKKGGVLISTVPAHMFLWSNHDVLLHHKRRYSFSEFVSKIAASGLDVVKASYWNFFLFPLSFAYKMVSSGTNTGQTSRIVNCIFLALLRLENSLIRKTDLPLGVSIYCVSKK